MLEIITDLANKILFRADWNPSKTHSPHCAQIIEPDILTDNITFAQALPANVAVTPLKHGKVDCYIYDLILVVLHLIENSVRAANAVPLAMHTFGRPVHPNKPIPRCALLCFRKLSGKCQLA